jgi:tetratricopeptide (TPR) repeat protein
MNSSQIFAFGFFLIACGLLGYSWAQDPIQLMKEADALYEERADIEKCRKSIEIYKKILELNPKEEAAAWKITRSFYWLGSHSPKEKRIVIFEEGISFAKMAVELNPQSVGGHFWLGVSYGLYGEERGILKSLSLIDPIKEQMQEVLRLDPAYQDGGADRVLGRLYFKVPGLLGGSKRQSVEHLKKAIAHGPNNPMNHLYLAETYLKMKKKDLAEKALESAMNAPGTKDPGDEEDKAKARELLKKHFDH